MKKNKKILIGILVLISLLIILPFLISIRSYLNDAEALVSDELGVPVTISSGRLVLFPSPRVVINGLNVGKSSELKVEQVTVIPSLSTIFSETRVIDIDIIKPIVKKSAIDIVSAMLDKRSASIGQSNAINIQHITVDELSFDWPDMKLPMLNLEVNLTGANQLDSAKLETLDAALIANITPEAESYLISVRAKKWTLPVGLPLFVDSAELDMHLKANRLEIPRADIAMYGGKVTANLNLLWNKSWRTNGNVKVAHISVKEPSRLVSKAVYLSGKLSGNGYFSGSAKDVAALADHLNADFKFKVNDGVLHGLDLIKVASLLTKQTVGGQTAFDEFSGVFNAKGKQYHLNNLEISSGLLSGTGQVKINANKELDGAGEVELKRSASLVAIPLDVSGTVGSPVVLPSKAALAGAVAGTAILGPGVGTSVGIKAAGAIGKLKGLFQDD
ncbi:MAG: AsmA family protein [Methylotenera sp.]|uniref:AsmA family protein n=1 Tax=Methylotenera sp. TaxID=2051956 RepID=UPI00271F1808|nr:AsmA family protein [Methylotenera sp.]MDO9150958.1 AsmA family protein [Methylotenera sp.]